MIRIGGANVTDIRVGNSPIREVRIGSELVWSSKVRFVAVGPDGVMMRSSDGMSWTRFTVGTNTWNDVCFGDGQFVVVGNGGTYATSQDGIEWAAASCGRTENLTSVCFGGGHFVMCGMINNSTELSSGKPFAFRSSSSLSSLQYSTLEIDEDCKSQFGRVEIRDVAYENGTFLFVGDCYSTLGSAFVYASTNGLLNQSLVDTSNKDTKSKTHYCVNGDGRRFIIGSTEGGKSSVVGISGGGGIQITARNTDDYDEIYGLCHGVVGGIDKYAVMKSKNKISVQDSMETLLFEQIGGSSSSYLYMNGICFGEGRFVAVGKGIATSSVSGGNVSMNLVCNTPVTMNAVCFRND